MSRKRTAADLRCWQAGARLASLSAVVLLWAVFPLKGSNRTDRVQLFPKVQAGEVLNYEIRYRSSRQTKAHSSIVMAQTPGDVTLDARERLRVEVLGVEAQGPRATIHARASFESIDSDASAKTPAVEFTILPDGRMDGVKGLDALSPDQQQAWQQWASRFAASAVFPQNGIKVAQKWKSEEAEKSPSPIARLTWIRESTYVGDELCRPVRLTQQGDPKESDQPADTCAVILTTSTLKQESSPKDATPEDFRIRALRTSGTATGNNKTITYISLKTGLVVRASDEADQSMAVTIAKADGSNRVHYDVHANSSAEVLLIAEPQASNP
jgi:hypothetical protein